MSPGCGRDTGYDARGEAGIGKSALLDYARRHAAPMAVLSASGVEAESDLAFAGLHELLRPLLNYLGELPDIQSGRWLERSGWRRPHKLTAC